MSDILNKYGISNFYDAAIRQGFARNYQYRVQQLGDWILTPEQLVYITTSTMPGRSITPIPVPFMGLAFQVPGAATYNQNAAWPVTFRCDERLKVRNELERWSFGTFNDKTSKGANIPDKTTKHQITLLALDNLGNTVKSITLIGAWVVNIGDLSYDLTGNGQVVNIQATLAYQYWRNNNVANFVDPVQPGDSQIYKGGTGTTGSVPEDGASLIS